MDEAQEKLLKKAEQGLSYGQLSEAEKKLFNELLKSFGMDQPQQAPK